MRKHHIQFHPAQTGRRAVLVLILLLGSVALLGASPQAEQTEGPDTVTITDMRGREVSVPQEVNSVIALGAGSLRLLAYMDAADRVIAVEDAGHGREKTEYKFFHLATYRIAYPELSDLPSIGSAENHEGIIAADPDLIISSTVDGGELDQLQRVLDIPVFAVNVDLELDDTQLFHEQLRKLGKVLNRRARAAELIDGIDAALADLEARSARVEEPRRAYAGGMMYYGPADLFRTTGDYLPFDLTGTENVMPTNPAGNRQPYMTSLEDLIAADPQYVFIDAANINLSKSGFLEHRGILEEQVTAFAERNVYTTLVYKYYGTNWENQLINIYFAGGVMYPRLYEDISIEAKAEEIWELFFNVPLEYAQVTKLQKSEPGRADWF